MSKFCSNSVQCLEWKVNYFIVSALSNYTGDSIETPAHESSVWQKMLSLFLYMNMLMDKMFQFINLIS